jgi:hypothetical protein
MASASALFDAFEAPGAARLAAWLEMTSQTGRFTLVSQAVEDVVNKSMAPHGMDPERAEDLILLAVILALGVGLFGASMAEHLGRPTGRARELALDLLRDRVENLQAPPTA